ncbi:MAG TPA: farnesyl diphosphate synthase [Desulfosalsimonadaceae bacterium]|nr:farnesyl diphosphate synthase [Desulfosalsimonadaceae bacterium]
MPASFDLKSYLEDKRRQVNQWLTHYINQRFDNNRQLCQAMSYSLMAGGKRLRPILCLAAAEAVGQTDDPHVMTCACALEMIHTYSLVHDDLPAMDNDQLRRGQPTCHVQFDEATAILAGDALLTLAFEVLSELAVDHPMGGSAMQRISRAAGYQGMIEGQMRDLEAESKTLDIDSLKQMHEFKTGALIEAAVVSGALLAHAASAQIGALSDYAKSIGLAFQVTDDILNVEGDPDLMGKAAGTDLKRQKSTYPGLMGLGPSKAFARELVNNALQAIAHFDTKTQPLSALANYIIERKR